MVVFKIFPMMQVIFSKCESEISPFLTAEAFYRNIEEKRVDKSQQEILKQPTCRTVLTLAIKAQDEAKMKLIAPRHSKSIQ